jgi:hypothetical protein
MDYHSTLVYWPTCILSRLQLLGTRHDAFGLDGYTVHGFRKLTLHWQDELTRRSKTAKSQPVSCFDYSCRREGFVDVQYWVLLESIQPTVSRRTMHELNTPIAVSLAG